MRPHLLASLLSIVHIPLSPSSTQLQILNPKSYKLWLQCAYAHGTSALRTHLINMNPAQTSLTWPAFKALQQRWAGRVRCPTHG